MKLPSVVVTRVVRVNPDQLIELAHRLKSQAMDFAYPGQVVLAPLTDEITLFYEPEAEFLKPVHRIGGTIGPVSYVEQ